MKIEISLTTCSPYHSAPVTGGAFVVNDDGFIAKKTGGAAGLPLTRTYKEPFFLPTTGEQEHFPIVRSMQILKVMRNIITRNVYDSLNSRGLQIAKISTYAGMEVGAASGKPTGMNPTLDQLTKSFSTPIAIFGGGSYSLSSTLKVGDGVLLHESLAENNLVQCPSHLSQAHSTDVDPRNLSYPVPITRADPVVAISIDKMDSLTAVENYQTQITEWQSAVKTAQSNRKIDGDLKKSDLNNLVACEAVCRGLTFVSKLELPDHAGESVKGCIINALLEMQESGTAIGGHINRGMGQFKVGVSVDGSPLSETGEEFDGEMEAYSDWLETVTPNDLSEFYEK